MKIAINGISLDYTDHGDGEPVVFVHGGMSDRRTWDHQQSDLGNRFRVTTYSRRFYWPNKPITHADHYSMVEQVDDLEQLILSLDLSPAHLVGNSYGAYLSLLLAMRKPEMVRSLVLSEPPLLPLFASNPPKLSQILRLIVTRPGAAAALVKVFATGIAPTRAAFERGDVEAGIRGFGQAALGVDAFERLSEERVDQFRANIVTQELLVTDLVPITDDDVRQVQTPTLLVTGEMSPKILLHLTDKLEELLPNTERVSIRNASHLMHEDDPEAFNAAVGSFLTKHS